jgi:hypothetical protein
MSEDYHPAELKCIRLVFRVQSKVASLSDKEFYLDMPIDEARKYLNGLTRPDR